MSENKMEHTEQEINDKMQKGREFKLALGKAFQSQEEAFPGAHIIGQQFLLGAEDKPAHELTNAITEELKSRSNDELSKAIDFSTMTIALLEALNIAMLVTIAERKDIRRN